MSSGIKAWLPCIKYPLRYGMGQWGYLFLKAWRWEPDNFPACKRNKDQRSPPPWGRNTKGIVLQSQGSEDWLSPHLSWGLQLWPEMCVHISSPCMKNWTDACVHSLSRRGITRGSEPAASPSSSWFLTGKCRRPSHASTAHSEKSLKFSIQKPVLIDLPRFPLSALWVCALLFTCLPYKGLRCTFLTQWNF